MVIIPKAKPPRVPSQEELYNLAFIYLVISLLCLVSWGGFEVINRVAFALSLDQEGKVKPALLLGFVFFLGMALAFFNKARVSVFTGPRPDDKVNIRVDPNSSFIRDAFIEKDKPADTGDSSGSDPKA